MVIEFSVKNFYSIKEEAVLSFEASYSDDLEDYYVVEPRDGMRLLKLGLIYGANASGKTTVLRALDFVRELVLNPLDKKTDELDFKPFLFDENTPFENTHFALSFVQNKVKYLLQLELNKKAIVSEKLYFFSPNKALVYERSTDVVHQVSRIVFGSKIKADKKYKNILEANTLWNNTVLGGFLKTNFNSSEMQECIDWFEEKLKPMITPRTNLLGFISEKINSNEINKQSVVDILRKADFNISDVILKREDEDLNDYLTGVVRESTPRYGNISIDREVFFRHKIGDHHRGYALPYKEESRGTQRYFQFSGLLDYMIKNKTIFLIDELESSLHPDLLRHFLLSFLTNTAGAQLIATTHYRELLMERDIFRNDAIWFTEKDAKGGTELFSLNDFDSSVVRNTSSIFNAYKIGKLGAVPQLDDYYISREEG